MAQLSPRRALYRAAIATALGTSVAVGAAPARAEVNLHGNWHVLVHYKDDASANPDTPRWDDRVWSFEPSGSRLRWMEWPLVTFSNETGRFERRATGQYARVMHFWEPNESQLGNIRQGLVVNDRGAKVKTLRKDGDDWRSTGRARVATALTITYQENWIVESAGDLPVFIREEVLGPAGADRLEGRTEYRTQEIQQGGDLLIGTYERDGTRRGSFRMMRAGERRKLEEKSQKERQQEAWQREVMSSQAARQEIRDGLEKALEARGGYVEKDRLEELVDEWLRLFQSGVREDEIGEQLVQQVLREAADAP
jgi:hypothetical protein